jgi:hypothetical protein
LKNLIVGRQYVFLLKRDCLESSEWTLAGKNRQKEEGEQEIKVYLA